MPELPEVETVKCCLELSLINVTINKLEKMRDSIRYSLNDQLAQQVSSAKIIMLRRRAKYLLIDLNNDYSLIVHLGMTGRLTLQDKNYVTQKHDHLIFHLDNFCKLVFNDSRRFGMVYSMKTNLIDQQFFNNLGIEPLSSDITFQYLKDKLLNRIMPIKNLIMDNNIIVGIGNIYASESLFIAKIHPQKPSNSLTDKEINSLILAVQNVLIKAIAASGTTLRNFINGDSKPGYFQQQLQVYGQENQQCFGCNNMIKKMIQAGRATYYCPNCQML